MGVLLSRLSLEGGGTVNAYRGTSCYQRNLSLDKPNGKCWGCGKSFPLTLKGEVSKSRKTCGGECRHKYLLRKDWSYFRHYILHDRGDKCERCGATQNDKMRSMISGLHVHHIKPISQGGKVCDEDNVLIVCSTCHGKEHQKLNSEARQLIKQLKEVVE